MKSWPSIVGENLASKAHPARIRYRKHKKQKKPLTVLEIAVNNSEATMLHYQKDLILQRINHIFGEDWIADIKFVTHTTPLTSPIKKSMAIPPKPLSQEAQKKLSDILTCVVDEDLKLRLNSIGSAILQKD